MFKPIFCEKFEIAAGQKDANLVQLEKCCQTHIFLQNFVLIQARTSPPKICKILLIFLTCAGNSKISIFNFFVQTFANFWRARSRLYQNEILQENMRLTAFFNLYKTFKLLHRSKLNILAKKYVHKAGSRLLQPWHLLSASLSASSRRKPSPQRVLCPIVSWLAKPPLRR